MFSFIKNNILNDQKQRQKQQQEHRNIPTTRNPSKKPLSYFVNNVWPISACSGGVSELAWCVSGRTLIFGLS